MEALPGLGGITGTLPYAQKNKPNEITKKIAAMLWACSARGGDLTLIREGWLYS